MSPGSRHRVRAVLYEVTARCDNRCLYCYNVWKLPGASPPAELPPNEARALVRRVARARGRSRPAQISFTGGEPLLRDDLETLVAEATAAGLPANLITNGRRLDAARARALVAAGCRLVEIPLLGPSSAEHDALAGAPGAFEGAVRAVGAARSAGARVVAAFVATRRNVRLAADTARLALALGADGFMFLRFNPGGAGATRIDDLLPGPEQLVDALRALRDVQVRGGLPVSVSVPIPPCVIDPAEMNGIAHGFCAAGTENAYLGLSPDGRLRPCNHSPTILGDARHTPIARLLDRPEYRRFCAAVPPECRRCPHFDSCRAGCRAAAESCFGDPGRLEPLAAAHGRIPGSPPPARAGA
jgi:pyrroloquinoline quinone biosynthesis protein E